jgi:hypothetical protein
MVKTWMTARSRPKKRRVTTGAQDDFPDAPTAINKAPFGDRNIVELSLLHGKTAAEPYGPIITMYSFGVIDANQGAERCLQFSRLVATPECWLPVQLTA